MKIAFHFNEQSIQSGENVVIAALGAVRSANRFAHTKVFTGTLLFSHAASETSHEQGQSTAKVNKTLYEDLVEQWASSHPLRWHALRSDAKKAALEDKVFAVCFETIDATTATSVDAVLQKEFPDIYLGALEVDETLESHLGAYLLIAIGRIDNDLGSVFWDGITDDTKMHYQLDWFRNAGFNPVTFESLSGRFTIFDLDSGVEQTHRNAQSRQWMRELFDSVVDHSMLHLSDGAPDIPEKLWSALEELRNMKVNEQASKIALACRRIFESVADSLFPPTDATPDDRKLGTGQYKNRLLKYLEDQRVGQTEQKLIAASMEVAAVELDNLNVLANKGLHSEFDRMQARRCLIRTVLLLDDLITVRQKPLKTRIRQDTDFFRNIAEN